MAIEMSKITDVYNQLIAQTNTLFLSKERLHNPYVLTENPDGIRKNAWGIRVNGATKEDLEFCDMSLSRSFDLILTRQFVSLAGDEDGFDSVTIELLEAQQSFAAMVYSYNELQIEDKIDKIDIVDISGITLETGLEKKFLNCIVSFNITISEKL